MKNQINRKDFLKYLSIITGSTLLPGFSIYNKNIISDRQMKLGLVTYLWGKHWNIPTLINNCTTAGILGVELRIDHAHGVKLELNSAERKLVKKQFADSKVEVLGMGTNQQFDYPDQDQLKLSIETAKKYVKLSYDIGGSGVKVKPNKFHESVPNEKTLVQIGKSLNELAKYADDFGQQIRLEVHGRGTQELPNIKAIMDIADHPNATVCWNCNQEDLLDKGLEYNFNLVKNRFGDTVHVREMNLGDYPYQKLMDLFIKMDYKGWILLECRTKPDDKVKALIEQRLHWEKIIKRK